jgi:hypothetical protein
MHGPADSGTRPQIAGDDGALPSLTITDLKQAHRRCHPPEKGVE